MTPSTTSSNLTCPSTESETSEQSSDAESIDSDCQIAGYRTIQPEDRSAISHTSLFSDVTVSVESQQESQQDSTTLTPSSHGNHAVASALRPPHFITPQLSTGHHPSLSQPSPSTPPPPERAEGSGTRLPFGIARFAGLWPHDPSNTYATPANTPEGLQHCLEFVSAKRSRAKMESESDRGALDALQARSAVAVIAYRKAVANSHANDIWPDVRSSAKLPVEYHTLNTQIQTVSEAEIQERVAKIRKTDCNPFQTDQLYNHLPNTHVGRPIWGLPVELVQSIASHLSRDDIKSLRMVSHELDYLVSQVLFETVVVPFNTEIYGMLEMGTDPDIKGKCRADSEKPQYLWKNANGDDVYSGHGLDVFKGFGKHIIKFGMSFEVDEDTLSQPPGKSNTQQQTSFWGRYNWPLEGYCRFDAVAGLEIAADEMPRMRTAFSELKNVKELALSIDSGLGWLNGPDRSIRARILQKPSAVFGSHKKIPDRRETAQQELWTHIQNRHQVLGSDVTLARLYRLEGMPPLLDRQEASMMINEQPSMPYLHRNIVNGASWAFATFLTDVPVPDSFDDSIVLDHFVRAPPPLGAGILFTTTQPVSDGTQFMGSIIPVHLTKEQKEWLLETEWAQRAFLSSYMLSIIDNPTTFSQVHTLNFSKLSDCYLPILNRKDFWDALPQLKSVTLIVAPGWRTVHKDEAGYVNTQTVDPTGKAHTFFDLLRSCIADRANIKNLAIGWVGGGEHAEGLHARNRLLMPMPLMPLWHNLRADYLSETMTELDTARLCTLFVHLRYVKTLTLKNCWITPHSLMAFVKRHDRYCLKNLVLDSVSLTAVLRPDRNLHRGPHGVVQQIVGPVGLAALWALLNINAGQGAAQPHTVNTPLMQLVISSLLVQSQRLMPGNTVAGATQATPIYQAHIAAFHTQLQHLHQQFQQLHNHNQAPSGQQQVLPPTLTNAQGQQASVAQMLGLIHQFQIMQQVIALPANLGIGPLPQAAQQSDTDIATLLRSKPRLGSWIDVIDRLSPGTTLGDFGSAHSNAFVDRQTSLESIEFISCGYAKLPNTAIDQTAVEPAPFAFRNPEFLKQRIGLAPAMLDSKWRYLGEIIQDIQPLDLLALRAAWGLRTGWDDAEEARAVEFDGLRPGGTGRFTGVIRRPDNVDG